MHRIVQVESVDAHAAHAVEPGGHLVVPKMPIPGVGWVAYGTDSTGNLFGIDRYDENAA